MTELRELHEQLRELCERRLLAREHVEAALSELQRAIVEALDGERLRLHQLHTRDTPYRGVVLRGKFPDRKFDADKHPNQLVLREDGHFVMAWLDVGDDIADRALRADDLDAEDLPQLVERILYALQHHMARIDAAVARYQEVGALAQRISDALVVNKDSEAGRAP